MNETNTLQNVANPRLDDAEIAALKTIGTMRQLRDGEPLFQVGERRGGFFVVLSGAVEILDPSGEEPRILGVHRAGEFTGDIDILSRRRPVVSAVARADTQVLHVPSTDIRHIIVEQPALGERILKAFIARRDQLLESGFQGPRVVGSERSRQAFHIREFLARNQIPFTWIGVEAEPAVVELLQRLGLAEEDMPAVVCGDLPLLRNPSIRELAEAIGLKRRLRQQRYDLVVVGAGPAGLAAAVYGASEGLSTLVLDSRGPGGQAGASMRIENYLGFPTGITGAELMGRALLQAQKFGAEFSTPSAATELDVSGPFPVVAIEGGERVEARCVLIATGADYTKLDVPDRQRFEGLGVYYAATHTELASCRGAEVVVVGGGNAAGQAIVFLAPHMRRVRVLLRGGDLGKSMSSYLVERVQAADNVEVLYHTAIGRMLGDTVLEAVEIENTQTGERRTISTPAVFSFVGAVPRTDWRGTDGWTDGEPHLGTPPEKDIGFPYRSCFGPEVDAAVAAYSWQRCLIDSGIYADWVDRGHPQPQHRAWALYLGWVFDQIRPTLRAARLTQVEAAGDTALTLTLERDGTQEALIVDGLVITGPGEPLTLPTISCDNTHCILDGRNYWLKRQLFASIQGGRVAVIGSGETAASIAVSLLSVPGLSIEIISRRGVIYSRSAK